MDFRHPTPLSTGQRDAISRLPGGLANLPLQHPELMPEGAYLGA